MLQLHLLCTCLRGCAGCRRPSIPLTAVLHQEVDTRLRVLCCKPCCSTGVVLCPGPRPMPPCWPEPDQLCSSGTGHCSPDWCAFVTHVGPATGTLAICKASCPELPLYWAPAGWLRHLCSTPGLLQLSFMTLGRANAPALARTCFYSSQPVSAMWGAALADLPAYLATTCSQPARIG